MNAARAPFVRFVAFCLLLSFAPLAALAEPSLQALKVEMSDGVKLATDVFLPETGAGPFPTILIRTPYDKAAGKGLAANLCPQGYAVVAQDMRGRFASEGHHSIIFSNDGLGERHDGHDTMNWITKQKWSDGKIVSWGGSALGIVQNQAAPNAPDSLKGQVVIMAFSDYYHQAAYQGGVWRHELLEGWLTGTGMLEINLKTFKNHPTYDDFWKKRSAELNAPKVNAPGVYIGGWYDIFLQGTINSFTTIQENGGPNAKGKNFLVIGPLAHGNFNQKVDYPNAANAPINAFAPMNLIAHWAKGKQADVEKLKPVHYYVMGDTKTKGAPGNYWRSVDSWPPKATDTAFYLHPDKLLKREKPSAEGKRDYKYDPANPVPTVGGQNLFANKGPMDQRLAELRRDVLVFTSDELTEPLEVTGRITAKLYVESDCPDTDFTVKLTDVHPDGESLLVTDGIQRASLRESFEKPSPLTPGKVYELTVDLWSTSLVFNKGHRIRVAVSSSNSPRFEPNANTGDPHPVPGKTRVANNAVHFSAQFPSHILLPVYAGEK